MLNQETIMKKLLAMTLLLAITGCASYPRHDDGRRDRDRREDRRDRDDRRDSDNRHDRNSDSWNR
jgi:hypothetical protein